MIYYIHYVKRYHLKMADSSSIHSRVASLPHNAPQFKIIPSSSTYMPSPSESTRIHSFPLVAIHSDSIQSPSKYSAHHSDTNIITTCDSKQGTPTTDFVDAHSYSADNRYSVPLQSSSSSSNGSTTSEQLGLKIIAPQSNQGSPSMEPVPASCTSSPLEDIEEIKLEMIEDTEQKKERKQFNFVQVPDNSPVNVANNAHLRHIMVKHAEPSHSSMEVTPSGGKRKYSLSSMSSPGITYQAPTQQHMFEMMKMMNSSQPPSPLSTTTTTNRHELKISIHSMENMDNLMELPEYPKSASIDNLHPVHAHAHHYKIPSKSTSSNLMIEHSLSSLVYINQQQTQSQSQSRKLSITETVNSDLCTVNEIEESGQRMLKLLENVSNSDDESDLVPPISDDHSNNMMMNPVGKQVSWTDSINEADDKMTY